MSEEIKLDGVKPVPTLYIRNLDDRIKPEGKWLPFLCLELQISLFHLFSQFGEVIQVRLRAT